MKKERQIREELKRLESIHDREDDIDFKVRLDVAIRKLKWVLDIEYR